MKSKLSGLQNILWAIGIMAAGLALLVGLIISMSARNNSERMSGTMTLGETVQREKRSESDSGLDAAPPATLMELPSTQKTTIDEVFTTTFMCDKTILGLRAYVESYGNGEAVASIWTDNGSGFYAANADRSEIVFVDGSLITPGNAAMITKPRKMVIYIGGDGLADTTEQDFITGYTALVKSIQEASPATSIICCSIASISSNYQGADGLTPELVARANNWIRQVCIQTGAWYADLASLLNDSNGYLSDAYLMPDGRSIAPAGIAIIVDYFRFHGVN